MNIKILFVALVACSTTVNRIATSRATPHYSALAVSNKYLA